MCLLDYAGHAFPVEGLGPGRRVAIWVRGCRRRCPGCLTPELWDSGTPQPVAAIAAELAPVLAQADGLTISGGEPFDQAEGLVALIDALRVDRDVEVALYTGYLLEELTAQHGAAAELLARLDVLIDGPFLESAPNTRIWRGSDNQRIHQFTERARRYGDLDTMPMPAARPLQVQLLGPGQFRIIGIPHRGTLAAYQTAMAARGLEVQHHG